MFDIRTVVWKEWKGLLRGQGSRMKMVLTLFVPLAWFGLYMPWQAGHEFLNQIDAFFAAAALPLLVGILVAPDSFAGERERHTLATLLASRLPDRAILFGKALFVAGLAWSVTMVVLAIGLVTVNIRLWGGGFLLFGPRIGLGCLGLSVIMATMPVGAGILISLRSPTVQVAQQSLTAALFIPPTVLGPILLMLGQSKPEWRLRDVLTSFGFEYSLMIFLGVFSVLDITLFYVAQKRFQRSKLVSN